jgi:hypothetical protein
MESRVSKELRSFFKAFRKRNNKKREKRNAVLL